MGKLGHYRKLANHKAARRFGLAAGTTETIWTMRDLLTETVNSADSPLRIPVAGPGRLRSKFETNHRL